MIFPFLHNKITTRLGNHSLSKVLQSFIDNFFAIHKWNLFAKLDNTCCMLWCCNVSLCWWECLFMRKNIIVQFSVWRDYEKICINTWLLSTYFILIMKFSFVPFWAEGKLNGLRKCLNSSNKCPSYRCIRVYISLHGQ